MDLKPGHKQIVVQEMITSQKQLPRFSGEWKTKPLGEVIVSCSSGATPYRGRPDYYKGSVKWITSGELNYNLITDTLEHISNEAVEHTNLKIHPTGTFLMAITGLEAAGTRGACGIVGNPAATNQSCMAIYPTSELKTEYLYHYYVFRGKKLALQYCQGTKQQSYTAKLVKLLPIDLPPSVEEQQAIATALSDVDALIELLDRLIAKKRDIKQAAMQELLTGKRRLPGFEVKHGYKHTETGSIPEDWDLRPLGELVTFLDGKRRPVKDADRAKMRGSIPYYGASGIVDYVNDYLFDEDLILLGEDGENILSRNCRLAFRISGKTWVNNHAHVLRPNPEISIGFLTDYLESLNYEQYNSGTAQPKLNKQTCIGILIALPPTKTEQTAIAAILSDMDAEIATLEEKLKKSRRVKQGMMQELLTGQIRLAKPEIKA